MFGSPTILLADHHWDDDHDGDAPVSVHDSNGGESQLASHSHDRPGGISAGGPHPVMPAQEGNGDDQEDCGLVIGEGDVPVFDNVPCIKLIVLPPLSSLTLTQ